VKDVVATDASHDGVVAPVNQSIKHTTQRAGELIAGLRRSVELIPADKITFITSNNAKIEVKFLC
jgi:hypothetical protein